MLDASDIKIKKFKDNRPGPDWENYFIKVSYLKIYKSLSNMQDGAFYENS